MIKLRDPSAPPLPIAGSSHQDIMETVDQEPMETTSIGMAETIRPPQQHYSQTSTYNDDPMVPEPLDFEKSESDVDDDESDDESDEDNVELGEINEFYESCLKPDPKHNSYLVSTIGKLEKGIN